MKKLLILLVIPFLFASCDEGVDPENTNEGTVDINFKAFYDTDNLVLGDFYDYPDGNGSKINFTTLTFYISDINLADEVRISDAVIFDFSKNHSSSATAPDGETNSIEAVTIGDYDGIEFGLGLNAALNATNPADYKSSEALSQTSMYWDWRGSYIFVMIEGNLDTDGDGAGDIPFVYHMGSDALFRDASFSTPITVEKNETTTLNFEINTKDIFVTSNGAFDIESEQISHSGVDDEEVAQEIMTNVTSAIKIK